MALLRNREVQILRVASEVDGSTFVVRYPDGETEMAKMNELIFSKSEYDSFVKTQLPEVNVMDDASIKERAERTKAEDTKEDKEAQDKAKKAEEARPEAIKPNLKPMQTLQNTEASKNVDAAKPSTYPDNRTEVKKAGR